MKVQSILGQKESNIQLPALEQNDSVIMGDQDFQYLDYINSMNSTERRKLIRSLNLCKDYTSARILNELVLFESRSILQNKGQQVFVTPDNSRSHTNLHFCYYNSFITMNKGYRYVEGFVRRKESGYYIAHAWNSDYKGNHVDFTYSDPEKFDYFGVVVHKNTILKVAKKSKFNIYDVLPFVNYF
jgi:hypothetical protein